MGSARRTVLAGRRQSRGGRVRFSAEARRAALEHVAGLAESGRSLKRASRELGVGYETLRRWQREERRPLLRAVQVAEVRAPQPLVVVLPGGLRVEGLDLASVVELAGRLR